MYDYQCIVERLTQRVISSYPHQVLDPGREDHGAWITPGYGMASADHTASGAWLARAGYVLLADGSPLRGDTDLFHRVIAAIEFTARMQRPTGLIDLPKVDFDSPPDTAFLVQALCPVLTRARELAVAGDEQAAELAERLSAVLRRAAAGMIDRGFRTPNHRWVVCSALACAMTLFPDLPARPYIDRILAETIDINADGDYSERSSAIYNAVCNRAMRLLADNLDMPDLLEHVRKNLNLTVHMLHPNGTVITSASRRQDVGTLAVPCSLADSFFDMAHRDSHAVWATIADQLAGAAATEKDVWLLHPFWARPQYRTDTLPRQPRPTRFTRLFAHSRIWRHVDGELSIAASAGQLDAVSLRYGRIDLSMQIIGRYFNEASQFCADTIQATPDGVQLLHRSSARREVGWDLPLNRPVQFTEPAEFYRLDRERWPVTPLDIALELRLVERGVNLHVRTEGMDHVPFTIGLLLSAPGTWEGDELAMPLSGGESIVLKAGGGTFHNGVHGIHISPGGDAHRMDLSMPKLHPSPRHLRLLIPLLSPLNHTLQLRFGPWSEAQHAICPLNQSQLTSPVQSFS